MKKNIDPSEITNTFDWFGFVFKLLNVYFIY